MTTEEILTFFWLNAGLLFATPQNIKARSLVIDVLLLHLCVGLLGVLYIHKMSYLQLLYSV